MSDKKVIIDVQTTGLDISKDRIIRFSGMIVDENHYRIAEKCIDIMPDDDINISIGAYMSHRISEKELAGCPSFKDVANEILDFIGYGEMDVITYNGIRLDMPFLKKEFNLCGIDWSPLSYRIYDVFQEDIVRYNHSLDCIYERYEHRSFDDLKSINDKITNLLATYRIFHKQQQKREYGPIEMITEDNFVNKMDVKLPSGDIINEICFTIGKYKNIPIKWVYSIDVGYITWCLSSSTVDKTSKDVIRNVIEDMKNSHK